MINPLQSAHNLPTGVRIRDIEGTPEPDEPRRGRCWWCQHIDILDDDGICCYCAEDHKRD